MISKKVYLAWQDPQRRSWHPVGILSVDENGNYRFSYTKGAPEGFMLARMADRDRVYHSDRLFPVFTNRLLSGSRPEYQRYLNWLGVSDDSPLDLLAMTEGTRATDTLQVFRCPTPNPQGEYEVSFFSHGLRHLTKRVVERVTSLKKGESLFLAWDMQNRYDSNAMALRTDDPVEFVGYCPRYLSPDFRRLLTNNRPDDVVVTVERVNEDAPLNLRLRCKLVSPWPAGFQPCSGEEFQPLVHESPGPEHLVQLESPVGHVPRINSSKDWTGERQGKSEITPTKWL